MDAECENQEGVVNKLKVQFAQALRSIQWSYAIFWSFSSKNPGVLEWVDGYYNGYIKTRKTVQAAEVNADRLGLQGSEQLRELYESFLVGETNPQANRPSAALSPEDLSEAEWYYLVCMSFTFNIGQGLPGRTLLKNQTIWLCNADQVETKIFSRALLAKSAGIKTVVCFPCLGGVIELGVTELVLEDLNLIERIKASFLEIPYQAVAKPASYISDNARNDRDFTSANSDYNMPEADINPIVEGEEDFICSPDNSSNGSGNHGLAEDFYIAEGVKNEASRVQSWYLMDEETSNQIHNPVNSTGSISQSAGPKKHSLLSNGEKLQKEIQEYNQKEMDLNPRSEDIHYQGVLSTLLKGSDQLILGPYYRNGRRESSFISWKKEAILNFQMPQSGTPQRLLKKILLEVAKMHTGSSTEPSKGNGKSESIWQMEVNEMDKNHAIAERRRREKLNDRFVILGSLVPTNGKVDKLSVLDETIEYVKELEKRVEELESSKELLPKTRTPYDAVERTSDNYGTAKKGNSKKRRLNQRKACDIDDISPDNVTVSVTDKDITIEMKFPWREGVLLEIMETMSSLHLDSDSVQSTNNDGILLVAIKSKIKRLKVPSPGEIRQAFQRVIKNC